MKNLLGLYLVFFAINVSAIEIDYNDAKLASSVTESTVDCGLYKVKSIRDSFDKKYNRVNPNYFPDLIPGFMGSHTIVSLEGILDPSGKKIPRANNLESIKANLREGREYLPFSYTCSDTKLIVSYWSGGNCPKCSVYVAFDYKSGSLVNPKKVTYKEYEDLKNN